jgi:hypothetical protein
MGRVFIAAGSVAMAALTTLALMPHGENHNTTWYTTALTIVFAVALVTCLLISVIYFRRYLIYLTRQYQKPPLHESRATGIKLFPSAIGTGTEWTFTTSNAPSPSWKFEYTEPIQSVRFMEPVEKFIWPTDHDPYVDCEHRILVRWRNKLLGIPTPRIVVKQFTEKGIILAE